jgi:hypothetical protein
MNLPNILLFRSLLDGCRCRTSSSSREYNSEILLPTQCFSIQDQYFLRNNIYILNYIHENFIISFQKCFSNYLFAHTHDYGCWMVQFFASALTGATASTCLLPIIIIIVYKMGISSSSFVVVVVELW